MMQANGSTNGQHTTAIVPVHHDSIEPQSIGELRALAKDAAESRFYGATTPAQALLLMLTGRDLGLSYTQSLRSFHVIEGKATLTADGMVAVCLQHQHLCEYFRCVEATDAKATWETKRKGQEPVRYTFTVEEAQRAGLVKPNGNWQKYPRRMVSARAKAFLARDVFGDVLMGLYTDDEVRESVGPERHEAPRQIVEMTIVRDETMASALARKLSACESKSEFDDICKIVKSSADVKEITADESKSLRELAKAVSARLKAAAALDDFAVSMIRKPAVVVEATATHDADGVVVEATPMREPGED